MADRWRRSACSRGGHRGARPPPPLVPRLLPAGGAEQPARRPRSGPRPGRALVLGPPRRCRAGWRGDLLHDHVVPRGERRRGLRRRAPARRACTRGRHQGRLEHAPRCAARDADRLPQGSLHRLPVGPFRRTARGRPVDAPGSAHLSLGSRHGLRSTGQDDHRARWAIDRPLHVVPGEHPGRRLGARRSPAGQGPQRAVGCTTVRCGTGRASWVPPSTRSSSCCPGRCPTSSRRCCGRRQSWQRRKVGSRAISRSCGRLRGTTRPAADSAPSRSGPLSSPSWRSSRCPSGRSARRAGRSGR